MTAELALSEIDPSKIIDGTYGSDAPSYVMEGVCHNCREVVYGRFKKGQKTRPLECNHCGHQGGVLFGMSWKRLVK